MVCPVDPLMVLDSFPLGAPVISNDGRDYPVSRTMAIYPIVAALVAVETLEGVGPNRSWEPVNEEQKEFLPFLTLRPELEHIREIESRAAWQAQPLNAFLRERGFDIQLREFRPGDFGAASVLDLLVRWVWPAGRSEVRSINTGQVYPAVRLSRGLKYFDSPSIHAHPIVQLATQSEGTFVYLTMLPDGSGLMGRHLLSLVAELASHKTPSHQRYSGVIFPMVDLKQFEDIGWLEDLRTRLQTGRLAKIDQAVMQNVLKMNEVGARARSAVGIVAISHMAPPAPPPPYLVINRPFLIWFERDALSVTLFAGHITEDNWVDPGTLAE